MRPTMPPTFPPTTFCATAAPTQAPTSDSGTCHARLWKVNLNQDYNILFKKKNSNSNIHVVSLIFQFFKKNAFFVY